MDFYTFESADIKAMLQAYINGFDDEIWEMTTLREEDGDGTKESALSAYRSAFMQEISAAQKSGREPDHTEHLQVLIGFAGASVALRPLNDTDSRYQDKAGDNIRDWGHNRSGETTQKIKSAAYRERLQPEEWARHEAIVLHQAAEAEGWEWVQQFRQALLGGSLVPVEEIDTYEWQPALWLLTTDELNALSAATPALRSELLEAECGLLPSGERRFVGRFLPSGEQFVVSHADSSARPAIDTSRGFIAKTEQDYYKNAYFPGSALAEIREATSRLAKRLDWGYEQALIFLLSGEVTEGEPAAYRCHLRYHGPGGGRPVTAFDTASSNITSITLKVPIWLSAASVARIVRKIQRQALGAQNRPPTLQYLRLYYFVLTQRRLMCVCGNGTEKQREHIWQAWNLWCEDKEKAKTEYPETEVCSGQWSDLLCDWQIGNFAYFNKACQRTQQNLEPAKKVK